MNPTATLTLPNGDIHPVLASCFIGRSSSNHLVLDDASVSRKHTLIHHQGESEYWILDLGSSNGTMLNNRPIVQPIRIRDGDRIRIGDVSIDFRAKNSIKTVDTLVGSTLVQVKVSSLWLLIADIEGFTPLSQRLQPQELARTVGSWFAKTCKIVERYGGDIHKYLGDGWLACWFDEAGANRRVAQCLETLCSMRQEPPAFRLALHKGEVTTSGSIASADLGMMGPDVNYLFRIEKIAAANRSALIMSSEAALHISNHLTTESLGYFELKGFDGKHELHQHVPERNASTVSRST